MLTFVVGNFTILESVVNTFSMLLMEDVTVLFSFHNARSFCKDHVRANRVNENVLEYIAQKLLFAEIYTTILRSLLLRFSVSMSYILSVSFLLLLHFCLFDIHG